jgi:predicted O-methyltransferase YrrM
MRKISHWTPRYIYNRIVLALYEKQHPDSPWLTSSAVSILSTYLKNSDIALEWGSGRSTVWFAERVKHLVSVEDNHEWYQRVKEKLDYLKLNNTKYLLATDRESYIGAADQFQENSLDFVLVDGRDYRSTCAVKAVNKVRTGGIIVVDNANWFLPSSSHSPNSRTYEAGSASDEWQHFLEIVNGWRRIWTTNGVWDTALLIKS